MLNVILQSLGLDLAILYLDHVNSNGYAKLYQNIPKDSRDRASFTFFQKLNLGKTSTYPKYHLTISLATSCQYQCVCKYFITIFFTVLEIGPFSLFQNLELGKASTDKNVSSQSLGIDLVNINVYAKVYQNIPLSSRDFHFFRIWRSSKPRPMINVILQFLGLDLFNIKLSAKFYQNIPYGLRVNFHFFQNLNLGKTSTNPKRLLTISWATYC